MADPNFVILYVDSPVKSAEFYAVLLEKKPLEASATFAMFALDSGVMLGLWSKHTVEPAAKAAGGGGELAFSVSDSDVVKSMHPDWSAKGLVIEQAPTDMDF